MTFSAQRGPLLIDIGAVYPVQELERHVLTTSVESLFNQIVSSFYFPLWLAYGPLRRLRTVKNLLEYRRAGEQGLAFTASLFRRLTLGWKVVPGLSKARAYLHAHRYRAFFECVYGKIEPWYRTRMGEMPVQPREHSPFEVSEEDLQSFLRILGETIGKIDGKVLFDVSAGAEIGPKIAEHLAAGPLPARHPFRASNCRVLPLASNSCRSVYSARSSISMAQRFSNILSGVRSSTASGESQPPALSNSKAS